MNRFNNTLQFCLLFTAALLVLSSVPVRVGAQSIIGAEPFPPNKADVEETKEGAETIQEVWELMLAERRELEPERWEEQEPTIIVDANTKSLTDVLEDAPSGAVVQLAKGARVELGAINPLKDRSSATLSRPIAVVGETGVPEDAVVVLNQREFIAIQSERVYFKGVEFRRQPGESAAFPNPIVKVELSGNVFFKNCSFEGASLESAVGVLIEEGIAKFWRCSFWEFGGAGIIAQHDGVATLAYCELLGNAIGASARRDGSIVAMACRFTQNGIGYSAQEGGGGKLESVLFERNGRAWGVSAGSSSAVELVRRTLVVR